MCLECKSTLSTSNRVISTFLNHAERGKYIETLKVMQGDRKLLNPPAASQMLHHQIICLSANQNNVSIALTSEQLPMLKLYGQ